LLRAGAAPAAPASEMTNTDPSTNPKSFMPRLLMLHESAMRPAGQAGSSNFDFVVFHERV
jgi:hypothetical protein